MTKEERKAYQKKYKAENREKIKEIRARYREKNREKIRASDREWIKNNKERKAASSKKYAEKTNTPEGRAKKNFYMKERLANDPSFRILHNSRNRVRAVLKGIIKCDSTIDLIGCSINEFKLHLESKFDSKMSWENYGSYWEIDHIIPCSKFDFTDPAQQRKCFHFSNTQPMEKIANIRKGNR